MADLFAGDEVRHAKSKADALFNEALRFIRDPGIDPGLWFSEQAIKRLPYLGHLPLSDYQALNEYIEIAWEWLRLNHPQRGVFVPCGIGSSPHMEIH